MRNYINQVRNHPFIQERPIVKQFVKFSMVGVVNTVASVSVYLAATRGLGLSPLIANVIAFVAAVTISFSLNKNWTFRDQQRAFARQYSRFFLLSLIGLGLSESIIFWLHTKLNFHDLIAFFTAVTTVMFWNFFSNRLWTFHAHKPSLPS